MEALTEVVRQGKVRYLGFSEWPVNKIQAALALPGVARFVSSQPQYSMLRRAPEQAVIPLCRDNGISQIVWSPLAQGVLTGKYLPGSVPPPDSRAASEAMGGFFPSEWLQAPMLDAVQQLSAVAEDADMTVAQLALAWVLREPNVASAIVGATRPSRYGRMPPPPARRSIRKRCAASKRFLLPLWSSRVRADRLRTEGAAMTASRAETGAGL